MNVGAGPEVHSEIVAETSFIPLKSSSVRYGLAGGSVSLAGAYFAVIVTPVGIHISAPSGTLPPESKIIGFDHGVAASGSL